MAQIDRLIESLEAQGASELRLFAGAAPTLLFADDPVVIVERVLSGAQVRFLLGEILNEAATALLEENGWLSFGYTPPAAKRVHVKVRAWHGDTCVSFHPDPDAPNTGTTSQAFAQPFEAARVTGSLVNVLPPALATRAAQPQRDEPPFEALLRRLLETSGSDLHLSSLQVPMVRRDGAMKRLDDLPPPSESELLQMLAQVAPARALVEFERDHDTDFAYEIPGLSRFRVNLFRDRLGAGCVVRVVPNRVRTADELDLPHSLRSLCTLNKGLVLVTGPTGSGKSTTLAAMLDLINESREDHIITLEDPIEFVHTSKRCLVNQREVFAHTSDFKRALRAALREDPDVILVGEMRDLETVEIALETAETGHLVLGTLHTTTAASTIDRVIDQFPSDRQAQVRVMLAESLRGVIAQTLCRKEGGGRVAALEVLLITPAVSHMIREGKTFQIPSVMQTSRKLGMVTLNEALASLAQRGLISRREALLRAVDKQGMARALEAAGLPLSKQGADPGELSAAFHELGQELKRDPSAGTPPSTARESSEWKRKTHA